MDLAGLDYAVIGGFVLLILALGFSARLRDNSVLQFIAAGRSLTLPVFVATLVSTWYGGILGVGESVSYYGVGTWVLVGVPYYVFALLYAFSFAKRVRGSEQISLPERLELRFGKPVALLGALLVFLLAVPAAHVFMLGTLVQLISGWPLLVSLVVGAFVGTLFLYKGGLLADARVSILAFAMMYIGFAVIAGYCLVRYPLNQMLASLEPPMRSWDGGTGLPMVASFFILGAWTLVDPGFHQRVASSISPEVGKKGVLVSVLCWFAFDMLSIGTALYGFALQDQYESLKQSLPVAYQPPMLYPVFGNWTLPPGLKAVFFCGMIGTIVSAMVGYTLVSGATFGREIVARLWHPMPDGAVKMWTRFGFFAACLLAIYLGLKVESVVALWYSWSGAVVGAILIPVCLSYGLLWRSKASSTTAFVAMAAAFAVAIGWLIYGMRTGNPYLNVQIQGIEFSMGTLLPGLAVSAIVMGIGEAVARRKSQDE